MQLCGLFVFGFVGCWLGIVFGLFVLGVLMFVVLVWVLLALFGFWVVFACLPNRFIFAGLVFTVWLLCSVVDVSWWCVC